MTGAPDHGSDPCRSGHSVRGGPDTASRDAACASGPLGNADLAPVPMSERTWSMWHVAALWIGMAVCIPTYMIAAGMVSLGMTWWEATLTVLAGNVIVAIPMVLNAHAGTKYGIPFPVIVRASFGITGAHIPSIARALVACGWFGIQTWIGGSAAYMALVAMGVVDATAPANAIPVLGISAVQLCCFLAVWLVHVVIVVRGIDSIRSLESWAAPCLIVLGIALLGWAFTSVPRATELFAAPTRPKDFDFWAVFFPQLTAMVGFWATLSLNIPDFSRYCASQRDQAVGQLIGLPPTMSLFCLIGILVTNATVLLYGKAIWDPIEVVGHFGSTTAVVIAMAALLLATITTNLAANVVSPANGFSNLAPRRISFRTGALATCALGIVIMPWKLLANLDEYIFTWLIGYSALLGPIAGIMLCDYFVIRRTTLDVAELYDPSGPYRGVRWAAVGALVLAVLPCVPGFVNAATNTIGSADAPFGPIWDSIYTYAWFVGVVLGAGLYWIFTRVGGTTVMHTSSTH